MKLLKMKHLLLLSIITSAVISCSSPSGKENSSNLKYFRQLLFSETPYDQFKGIYPLTAAEAKKINNYTFTYNPEGKLTGVAYMRGDELLAYGSKGYARVEITYTDSTETHHYFNKNNESQMSGGAFASVYRLDKNGNRIGLYFLDKAGNKIENRNKIAYYVWKVLPDGMIQEKRYNMKDEETVMNANCPFYELRFSYDKNGYCVRLANYMADTLYNCTEENCGDIGVSYFLFDNNEKGALKQFAVYNVTGQMSNLYSGWSKFINTLDENGYVTESIYFDQDNEPLGGKTNPITVNKYDEHGAVIERQYLDKNRKLFVRPNIGAAVVKYKYDSKGNPADTTYLDAAMAEIVKK